MACGFECSLLVLEAYMCQLSNDTKFYTQICFKMTFSFLKKKKPKYSEMYFKQMDNKPKTYKIKM